MGKVVSNRHDIKVMKDFVSNMKLEAYFILDNSMKTIVHIIST